MDFHLLDYILPSKEVLGYDGSVGNRGGCFLRLELLDSIDELS
jgi:hypothetical protein